MYVEYELEVFALFFYCSLHGIAFKKEMVPLVHAESVELLGMIRMVGIYSTFFSIREPFYAHKPVLRKELLSTF